MRAYVHPALFPLRGTVNPPASKNYTTRYLLAAALADGVGTIHQPAVQDDAVALFGCLRALGAGMTALDARGTEVEFTVGNGSLVDRVVVRGFGSIPRQPGHAVNPGNAGAVLRFLLGTAALVEGEVRFETDHADSLGKRVNTDLLGALGQLGVEVECRGAEGCLPLTIRGGLKRIRGHLRRRRRELGLSPADPFPVAVSGAVSSQFVSSLLFLAPLIGEDVQINVRGELRSAPLIRTTRAVLAQAGIAVESSEDQRSHMIRGGQGFAAREWQVNGDWPGTASILAAAAVVPGSEIWVRHLREDEQGERQCLEFFREMGCEIDFDPTGGRPLLLRSPGRLKPARIDGDQCTDAVLAMMGAATAAQGECRFDGIRNLQFKECDRVRAPIGELRTLYAASGVEGGEGLLGWEPLNDPATIRIAGVPGRLEGGIALNGHGDHRVIMMLSVVALAARQGLAIEGVEHVAKSFPHWFEVLQALGGTVKSEAASP